MKYHVSSLFDPRISYYGKLKKCDVRYLCLIQPEICNFYLRTGWPL
jgi:hypothetical protein